MNLTHNLECLSRELEHLSARGRPESPPPHHQQQQETQHQQLPQLQISSARSSAATPHKNYEQSTRNQITPPPHSAKPTSARRRAARLPALYDADDDTPRVSLNTITGINDNAIVSPGCLEGVASRSVSASRQQGVPPSGKTRGGRIRVVVRKRPMSLDDVGLDCVTVDPPKVHIAVKKQRVDLTNYEDVNDFIFDDAFEANKQNQHIFDAFGRDLLTTTLQGGSASCFAYGQTGSGKTHTMIGNDQERGLYLLAAEELFKFLPPEHEVHASLYEIYCNSLFDLLNGRSPVVVREDHNRRVNVCGLTWHRVNSASTLWSLISSGTEQRRTGSTTANERSSRSHAVLTIHVRRRDDPTFCGTLNFVDLAGSERAADTATNDRQTRQEGAEINKSLLALKECIRALDEKKKHVPFRGSRLTEILRDSFTGNSRTVMIANISPASYNYEHTVNTLRYAFRVKGLSVPSIEPSKARNFSRPPPKRLNNDASPHLHAHPSQGNIGGGVSSTTAISTGANIDITTARHVRTSSAAANRPRVSSIPSNGIRCRTPNNNPINNNKNNNNNNSTSNCNGNISTSYLHSLTHDKLLNLLPQGKMKEKRGEISGNSGRAISQEKVDLSHIEQLKNMKIDEKAIEILTKSMKVEIARALQKRDRLIIKLRKENALLQESLSLMEKKKAECPICKQKNDMI